MPSTTRFLPYFLTYCKNRTLLKDTASLSHLSSAEKSTILREALVAWKREGLDATRRELGVDHEALNDGQHERSPTVESHLYGTEFVDQQSERDIAALMNLSIPKLRSIFSRGRLQLRDRLPKHRVTASDKHVLRKFLEERSKSSVANVENNVSPSLSPDEVDSLMSQTSLNRYQLYRQLYLLQDGPRGNMSRDSKHLVRIWINENRPRCEQLTAEDREHLKHISGWSTSQLNSFLHYLTERYSPVSNEARLEIREWVQHHKRMPTKEEARHLMSTLHLGRYQLRNLLQSEISSTTRAPVSEDKKALLKEWYKSHQRMPSAEEKTQLSTQSELNETQVYRVLYRLHQRPRGQITSVAKDMIKAWMIQHPECSPTKEESQLLQTQTGLNHQQILSQIQYLKEVHGKPTPETRKVIVDWLLSNNNRAPSPEEQHELCQRTGLSHTQIRKQIQYHREVQSRDK